MSENPVTPVAPATATPGNNGQGAPQSSATPSTQPGNLPGQEGKPDDKVTIPLKEYRDLQRDHARVLSFDKRAQFQKKPAPGSQPANPGEGADPEIVEQLRISQENEQLANRRAMQAEVREGVRNILAKSEFANLPQSTKDLILKNPSMLSEADNVDEALLDIEDYIRESAAINASVTQPGQGGDSRSTPAGHETPPIITPGSPAPVNAEGLEDISKLTGSARSRAIIRNEMKKKRGINS